MLLQESKHYFDERGQNFLSKMYRTLFSTTYYGMFQVGELTSGTHPVQAKDVQVAQNKNKMLFILQTSKIHWTDAKPQMIKISSNSLVDMEDKYCPFNSIRKYMALRRGFTSDDEPFFIFGDGTPVTPVHFRNILKLMISICGLDSRVYGVHRLRAGKMVDLFHKYHLSIESIKKIGRWKSNAIYAYLS